MAPVRVWGMSREETIDYAEKHDIAVSVSRDRIYSIDANIWGRTIECGILEDPWEAPPEDVFALTVPVATEAVEVTIGFEKGVPVALDGTELGLVALVGELGASPDRSASDASTWSRAAVSASRAARSTSARPRSR